jgi:hypothetical protein
LGEVGWHGFQSTLPLCAGFIGNSYLMNFILKGQELMLPTISYIANATTWRVLQNTENPAATVLLGAGLTHPEAVVRHQSLRGLVAKNLDAANMLVLSHWNVYDELDHALLREHAQQFSHAVRTLLSGGTLQIKKLMLAAVAQLDLCESADVLIELAINSRHPLHQQAATCLMDLCRSWGHACRTGQSRGQKLRPKLVSMLYDELKRYPKNSLIMEAWLSLVHWDDGQQRSLLSDTGHSSYGLMLKCFSESRDPAIQQFLVGYFMRAATPTSIMEIVLEHPDPGIALALANLINEENLPALLDRLRNTRQLACVAQIDIEQFKVCRQVQRKLQLIVAASKEDVRWALSTSLELAKANSAESRKNAVEILHWARPITLEKLIAIAQADEASGVSVRNSLLDMHQILKWLKHPSVVLREAATEFFREFTTENLIRQINLWPARMSRIMADFVAEVDHHKLDTLREHLSSPAHKRRINALHAVEYLKCADGVRDKIQELLEDPRVEVRVRVIDTLTALDDSNLATLIPQLLQDANTDVVDAANRALRKIERMQADKASS